MYKIDIDHPVPGIITNIKLQISNQNQNHKIPPTDYLSFVFRHPGHLSDGWDKGTGYLS